MDQDRLPGSRPRSLKGDRGVAFRFHREIDLLVRKSGKPEVAVRVRGGRPFLVAGPAVAAEPHARTLDWFLIGVDDNTEDLGAWKQRELPEVDLSPTFGNFDRESAGADVLRVGHVHVVLAGVHGGDPERSLFVGCDRFGGVRSSEAREPRRLLFRPRQLDFCPGHRVAVGVDDASAGLTTIGQPDPDRTGGRAGLVGWQLDGGAGESRCPDREPVRFVVNDAGHPEGTVLGRNRALRPDGDHVGDRFRGWRLSRDVGAGNRSIGGVRDETVQGSSRSQ